MSPVQFKLADVYMLLQNIKIWVINIYS